MSDEHREFSLTEIRKRRGEIVPVRPTVPLDGSRGHTHAPQDFRNTEMVASPVRSRKFVLPFDPSRVVSALKAHWRRLAWWAGACALLGAMVGWLCSSNSIKVTLVLRDLTTTFAAGQGEAYRPSQLAVQTLVELMTSPELARRVAARSSPPMSEGSLRDSVTASLGSEKDVVTLTLLGKNRRQLVALAELYADEAVKLGRELQLTEVSRMSQFYEQRIQAADGEMARIQKEMAAFQKESGTIDPDAEAQVYISKLGELLSKYDTTRLELELVTMQVASMQAELTKQNPVAQQLDTARAKLAELLSRLTDEHPSVLAQNERIAQLEKRIALMATNTASSASFGEGSIGSALYLRLVELQSRKSTLETELNTLDGLKQTLREKVTGVTEKGLGYTVIRAKLDSQKSSLALLANRQREAQLYEANAQGYFRLFSSPRLSDVKTLARWRTAFVSLFAGALIGLIGAGLVIATREIVGGRLKTAADIERVTGLPVLASLGDINAMTPAQRDQWAFRTWTALSARLSDSSPGGIVCGFISSQAGEGCGTWVKLLGDAAAQRGLRVVAIDAKGSDPVTDTVTEGPAQKATPGNPDILASPSDLIRRFFGGETATVAQVPLGNWVWNLERRQQWKGAMAQCETMSNSVVLVKMPPASTPEGVLLAENLPQVIWVAESGRPREVETRQQLETLRHAKCRLAGAVLNREPKAAYNL